MHYRSNRQADGCGDNDARPIAGWLQGTSAIRAAVTLIILQCKQCSYEETSISNELLASLIFYLHLIELKIVQKR